MTKVKKKRGWPKGKKRGPRKHKVSADELYAAAMQAIEECKPTVDPFRIRSVPRKSDQALNPNLSPFYGKMSKVHILLLLDLLKRAVESSIK